LVVVGGEGNSVAAEGAQEALLIDTTRCRHCTKCIEACQAAHEDGVSRISVTVVREREGERDILAVPMHCLHCNQPACVDVCQGRALTKTAQGPVILDQSRCVGCLSCANACPFRPTIQHALGNGQVFKCDLCRERVGAGKKPACVVACERMGHNALVYGTFDQVLEAGTQRAAEVNGVLLYPEGTSTLVLFSAEEFGQPAIQDLFGLTAEYPGAGRVRATITRYAHLGWVPVIGGLGYTILSWRKNRMADLAKVRREER